MCDYCDSAQQLSVRRDIVEAYCTFQLEYYKKEQEKRREDGDISDNDSAIDSARVWDLHVPLATRNGPRRKTDVCTVVQRAITLKNLHKVELLRYRAWLV
ncbi:hypothetical protein ANCCAN_27676 [Ancylostoma caninum]|uniref:Uncharacterized protein n=1 Tax=Ancylostoma caninum TaxID=29170 RepID=A0A368F8T7_ANCCA|nr:hypothetical protein ANCCAN_27676 [Ancylostoma caninum]